MQPVREKTKLHTATVREGVQKNSEKKRDPEGMGTEM